MSKKDFMRGVEAAVNAQKGFNEKQAAATEEIAKRVVKKIDSLGNIVDVVIDQLNVHEKERLYSLTEQFDPKSLDESERELLVSLIYTLSMQHEQNTSQQTEYYYNLKKYLGVANPSGNVDLSCVENIENVSESKGIYAVVCEFLFLKHGDHSYREEFEDFLDNFYVKPKDIKQVEEQINTRYEIMGAEDIVRHFDMGYDTFAEIADDTEQSVEMADGTGVSYKDLSEIKYNGDRLSAMNLPELHLERSYTSPQQITRKNIKLDSMTSINTSVSFKECVISYETGKSGKFILSQGASASFFDCCFLCSGEEKNDDYLISSDGCAEKVEFLKCSFKCCSGFIQNLKLKSMHIGECYIQYPNKFLNMNYDSDNHSGEILFDNNVVVGTSAEKGGPNFDFQWEYSTKMYNNLFIIVKNELDIKKSSNPQDVFFNAFSEIMSIFGSGKAMVCINGKLDMKNCTFYGLENCLELSNLAQDCTISNCEFINCSNAIKNAHNINDCAFIGCNGTIVEMHFENAIKNCSFLSCSNQVLQLDTSTVSNCEFKNIKANGNPIIKAEGNDYHHDMHSVVEYCTFDDIELGDNYLGYCGTSKKRSEPALYFKDCSFSNIHTERYDKEIICQYYEVGKVFTSSTKNVDVRNCSGIDKADNGKLSVSKPAYTKKKTNGDVFGAIFPESFCENLEKDIFKKTSSATPENVLKSIEQQIVNVMTSSKYGQMIDKEKDDGRMRQTNIYLIMGYDHGNDIEKVLYTFIQNENERISENIVGGYGIGVTSGYNGGLAKMTDIMGKDNAFKTFDEIYGLLFCKERFYFIEKVGDTPKDMSYLEIAKVDRADKAINITSKTGDVISIKGEKVTDDNIFNLFEYIVKTISA